MTSTTRPDTFDLDGTAVPMSLAFRLYARREYRRLRTDRGYGPMGARQHLERDLRVGARLIQPR